MSCLRAAQAAQLTLKSSASLTARRYASSNLHKNLGKPGAHLNEEARVSSVEQSSKALAQHGPEFDTHVDHGTSTFSPIPKRIMDGSEPGESVAAAVLSGAPIDLQARTARIYRPAKTATQSGDWTGHHWRMDWDVLSKGHRWENPLMGWQSSADYMQGTHLNFKTKEDAINFAQKQGYEYFVQEPNVRKFVPKAYANNFTHIPGKLKIIRTK
ncbi:MAG: hypothetical protein GOMPHAMPRED_006966 [Gomphillus americanus]|uniref:NADH dehydrogenase [ubiquinone] iron-sulfur protein 4, mitochondrial n=1 Tax=Gomphillus americanus TaxID=1940652 RepID=A0A8H3EWH9_9LECA|nr:MAG: hypothetical protein GOMPHAMPRED_006966 [Gomphillus americanus]